MVTRDGIRVEYNVCRECGVKFKHTCKRLYCSKKCRDAARAKQPKRVLETKTSTCANCGELYVGIKSSRYCSPECKAEFYSRRYKRKLTRKRR